MTCELEPCATTVVAGSLSPATVAAMGGRIVRTRRREVAQGRVVLVRAN